MMYDTRPFCNVYTYEGHPVRVGEQMDVEEFFNMLFDRLETAMKTKPQVDMLALYFSEAYACRWSLGGLIPIVAAVLRVSKRG